MLILVYFIKLYKGARPLIVITSRCQHASPATALHIASQRWDVFYRTTQLC